jgi:hypothetical protein
MSMTTNELVFPFLQGMSPSSRVWIYQNPEPIPQEVQAAIAPEIASFCAGWTSHQRALETGGGIWLDRFVVLAVDESLAGASGCSIDASVGFLRGVNASHGLNLFERMAFTYQDGAGEVHTLSAAAFKAAYAEGSIGPETLVADTLVTTLGALYHDFWKPLKLSWHARMV